MSVSSPSSLSPSPAVFRSSVMFFPCHFSTMSENVMKKVEDVMPIATGHEREELEAELQGREILDINSPLGPFGTKISYYRLMHNDYYITQLAIPLLTLIMINVHSELEIFRSSLCFRYSF